MITEKDKKIIYLPVNKSSSNNNQQDELALMNDTNMFKNIKLIKTDASGKTYEMINPQIGMKKMQLTITSNNVLKEVKYYYEKTEESPIKEVLITYSNVNFNPTFSDLDFSEKKYFQKINGKEVLTTAYKDYSLLSGANYR